MAKRRVVVTGLGLVTPLGLSVKETWVGILAAKSGIRPLTDIDTSEQRVTFAGTVPGFDPEQFGIPNKEARKIDPFIHYGLVAAGEALKDSGLVITEHNTHRVGVMVGSGIGGIGTIEVNHAAMLNGGPRRVSPFFIPSAIINMVAGQISITYGLRGPNFSAVSACTTGAHNIGLAARAIAYGDADVVLAGGAEKASGMFGIAGFAAARALSTRNEAPEKASRPWDKDRDGFVLSDGAGILVLEEYEAAKRRGAPIYAELIGFGMSGDAYHATLPDMKGAAASMRNALADGAIDANAVDYINAHGTSTRAGDLSEVNAVKDVFAGHAYQLALSSTKSMIGHMLGATGAVEAIFSVLALRDQIAPPTINLDNPDEGCDLDFVPHKARSMKIKVALSNSFGFGGTNASLLFRGIA